MLASWQNIEAPVDPAAHVAAWIAASIKEAITGRQGAFVGLSGGRTPRAAYAALAAHAIDWQRLVLVPTDERFVPPEDVSSNERMLRETLLDGAARSARFIPLWSQAADAAAAAQAADQRLAAEHRPFDLLLLGMGEDGHIASLFPGAAGLEAAMDPRQPATVLAIEPPAGAPPPALPRLTLSLRRLLWSRRITLLIAGAAKRRLLREAIETPDAQRWPVAALLGPGSPPLDVLWLEEAA
jgi:6-phosphogluconolactonase